MPFANTDSIVADDVNNMLRGFNRDNSDNSHTGDTNKTDLYSVSVTGATIGATGQIHFLFAGTVTGTAGNKTIDVDFGATNILTMGSVAGAADWYMEGWIINTATGAQRILTRWSDNSATTHDDSNYGTASLDTTGNLTLRARVTLANGGDTVTQTIGEVMVLQIT